MQGVDVDESCPRVLKRGEVVRIIEAEGLVARDADAYLPPLAHTPYCGRGVKQRWCRRRNRKNPVKVHLRCDDLASCIDLLHRVIEFHARHQAQVSLVDCEPCVVLHRPDHRHVRVVLDHRTQLGFVARAAEVIENHPGNVEVAVERLVAEQQRCDAARHAARIDDQYHRQSQRVRDCGVAVAAIEVEPVVEPLVALDDAHIGADRMPRE